MSLTIAREKFDNLLKKREKIADKIDKFYKRNNVSLGPIRRLNEIALESARLSDPELDKVLSGFRREIVKMHFVVNELLLEGESLKEIAEKDAKSAAGYIWVCQSFQPYGGTSIEYILDLTERNANGFLDTFPISPLLTCFNFVKKELEKELKLSINDELTF